MGKFFPVSNLTVQAITCGRQPLFGSVVSLTPFQRVAGCYQIIPLLLLCQPKQAHLSCRLWAVGPGHATSPPSDAAQFISIPLNLRDPKEGAGSGEDSSAPEDNKQPHSLTSHAPDVALDVVSTGPSDSAL